MKKKKILIVLVILLVLGGIGAAVGYSMWNQPHRDITSEDADFKSAVPALAAEFTTAAAAAEKKYSEKVVELSGEVVKITPGDSLTTISIKGNESYQVFCEMLPGEKDIAAKAQVGKPVKVKAFYSGYMEGDADFGMAGDILFKKGVIAE